MDIWKVIFRPACWIGLHDFYEIRRLNKFSHMIGCRRCQKRWGMNTDAKVILPWDMELEDHHRAMGDLR
jgi:hypothetical protein